MTQKTVETVAQNVGRDAFRRACKIPETRAAQKRSRMTSNVQRSPTMSREQATGQGERREASFLSATFFGVGFSIPENKHAFTCKQQAIILALCK